MQSFKHHFTKTSLKYNAEKMFTSHLVKYVLVGGSTFSIDLGLLYIMHGLLGLNIAASASFAYWISISYNFVLNRHWTFSSSEKKSLLKHLTLYFVLLVFNFLFTVTFVAILSEHFNYIFVKIAAVLLQTSWTFLVYKKMIFTEQRS